MVRVYAKDVNLEEAERTWLKLIRLDEDHPSQVFVCRMEVFSKAGESIKSSETFRKMQEVLNSYNVALYHKIIEVLYEAEKVELSELLIQELVQGGMKSLTPSLIAIMYMYLNLNLHDKLESAFSSCLEKCRSSQSVHVIYVDSLVKAGNLDKVEEIFNHVCNYKTISVNARPCNTVLSGCLSFGYHVKAEIIYDLMCQRKYDIESSSMEKPESVLILSRKAVRKPSILKLGKEQREILVGLLFQWFAN